MTLNCGLFRSRSNSLSTKGCGDSRQTESFELLRLVVTVPKGKKNLSVGQGSARGVFTNCYCRIGCIPPRRTPTLPTTGGAESGPLKGVYLGEIEENPIRFLRES